MCLLVNAERNYLSKNKEIVNCETRKCNIFGLISKLDNLVTYMFFKRIFFSHSQLGNISIISHRLQIHLNLKFGCFVACWPKKIKVNYSHFVEQVVLYVYRVVKYNKHLASFFMSTWWEDCKNMQEIEILWWLFDVPAK